MSTTDPKERILDACLDEVLGGSTPPDLTDQIMRALDSSVADHPADQAVSVVQDDRAYLDLKGKRIRRSSTRGMWMSVASVAALLAIMLSVGYLALRYGEQFTATASTDNSPTEDGVSPADNSSVPDVSTDIANVDSLSHQPGEDMLDNGHGESDAPGASTVADNRNVDKMPMDSSPSVTPDPTPVPVVELADSPVFDRDQHMVSHVASSDDEVVDFINQSLLQQWRGQQMKPSPKAGKEAWCRRVYLHLVGREPSSQELQRFVRNPRTDRGKLVDDLLGSTDFVDYWATHLADVLIGRSAGQQPSDLASREGLEKYLRDSLASGKAYDQLVFELLTANGSSDPGTEDFNGATNFLLAGIEDEARQATAHTTTVFLGQDLSCVQCHDQKIGDSEVAQSRFWQLNSFFRQAVAKKKDGSNNVQLVSRDFAGESGSFTEAEIYFDRPNGLMRVAFPVLPDGTSVSTSGRLEEVNRRVALANWLVGTEDFSKTLVNRMWTHFFHFGFRRQSDPVDPNRQPSHPELLAKLSDEFVARQYDLKSVMRWVALSDAFGLSSKTSIEQQLVDAPQHGRPLFSHYYEDAPRVRSAQESLQLVAQAYDNPATVAGQAVANKNFSGIFARAMPATETSGIIPLDVNLHLQASFAEEHTRFLDRVASSSMSAEAKVEHLFRAAALRSADARERRLAEQLFASAANEREALEAIWWALVSSDDYGVDR